MSEQAENLGEEQGVSREQSLSSVMGALEGLIPDSTAKEISTQMNTVENPNPNEEEEIEPENIDPNDTTAVANELLKSKGKKDSKSEESEDEEEEEEDEPTDGEGFETTIDSPIFGGKKVVKTQSAKKQEDFVFDGKEKVDVFVKEKTGIENLEALVSGFSELKSKSEEFEITKNLVSKYEGIFQQIPAELYQGIDAFLQGKDWKTPIVSKPNMDFSKDASAHAAKSLVDNYLPGEFSKEEWDDYNSEDPDTGIKKAIDLAVNTAKKQYEADKIALDSFKGNQIKEAQERETKVNSSIDESIEFLKKSLDGADDGYVRRMKQNLTVQKLNELFFNQDGTFKKEAALRISMAEHGYDMLEQYKTIAQHQSETKERQSILERTPAKPKVKKKSEDQNNSVRPEVRTAIDAITKGVGTTNNVY